MVKKYDLSRSLAEFMRLKSERSEWQAEWQQISDYLVPGRGIYNQFSKPRKRKLTSPKVVNTTAREALRVLTSGLQGGLTSPSRPWLQLSWKNTDNNKNGPLKNWLFECQRIMEYALQQSNFYPIMHSFYTEYAAFGTGSIYVGEDSDVAPFRFELLTAGEYAFSTDYRGRADTYYRTLFMTPRQMIERFGKDKVSPSIKDIVKQKSPTRESRYISVLECVYKEEYQKKPYTQVFWELGGANNSFSDQALIGACQGDMEPLMIKGFHEFPYPVARWDLIGQDMYGLGPGSEALPEIMRLQEMTRAMLMASHKEISPPLNIPHYMRGKVQTKASGLNYYKNPQEVITPIYRQGSFQFQGAASLSEQVEARIKTIFFNDVFITATRDPNASPMKAAEVHVKDGEKMLRLGPVIERIQNEFIEPVMERCFNIMLRKGLFPQLSPEMAEIAGDYKIDLVSPLAQAQKLVASKSIDAVAAFFAQAAQVDPTVLDKLDVDAMVDEYVDAHGAPLVILKSEEEVQGIRQNRAKQQQAEKQQQQGAAAAQMGMQGAEMDANTQKTRAEAGQIMTESLLAQNELGGL